MLAAIILLQQAWLASPSTDDFCNRLQATSQSVTSATVAAYREWTGRVLTTALLFATMAVLEPNALRTANVAIVLALLAAAWMLGLFASVQAPSLRVPAASLALAASLLGLRELTGNTVFWVTGGVVYTVPLLLLAAWLLSMRRALHNGDPGGGALKGFGLGLLVGNSIELVVPIALAYGIGATVMIRALQPTRLFHIACWRLAGVAVGATILAIAPGNIVRAGATEGSLGSDFTAVANGLRAIRWTLLEFGMPVFAIAATLFAASVSAQLITARPRQHIVTAETVLLLIGAILSITPTLLVPAQFGLRNIFYTLAILLTAALLHATSSLSKAQNAARGMSLCAAALMLIALPLYQADADSARAIRQALVQQDLYLRRFAELGASDAVIPPIGIAPPRTVYLIELSSDPTRWDNQCVAKYYGLRSVRVGAGQLRPDAEIPSR